MEGDERSREYVRVEERLERLLMHETDFVAAMATTCCELHHSFKDHFDWTGFYRVAPEGDALVVGPYQGTHGYLRIPFGKGVCGAAASQRKTQLVPDVHAFPGHIACSSTTKSEIVVPVMTPAGDLVAVLDVDSNRPDAFREASDLRHLERICSMLGRRPWTTGLSVA
ncbi:GAF domain-containing protein [Chloropicon roscoffensis]|uniref:GAF domain-containing protein n=1 Tax=Chloropicon roscoffensis TaxID=1461544 RepID=A0AAX4P287_9CHLO